MSWKVHETDEVFAALRGLCANSYRIYDPSEHRCYYDHDCDVYECAVEDAAEEYERLVEHCAHQREQLKSWGNVPTLRKLNERWMNGERTEEGAAMSITDELREYALGWDERNRVRRDLAAIADRIDERYKRDMATAQQVGYNEGEDAAMRSGWVELPKDADGVPIHVGDELCGYGRPNGGVFCKAVNERMVLVGEKDDGYKMWLLWDGSECRHHHAPTVEDVLQKLLEQAVGYSDAHTTVALNAIAEYAAKLRLAKEDA